MLIHVVSVFPFYGNSSLKNSDVSFKYCHILAEAVAVHFLHESRHEITAAEQ